ncbi:hypothetical protein N9N03_01250 [Chlamydiia bacterium]|nr:hypothetical protein [Chlamydiia bacterium]
MISNTFNRLTTIATKVLSECPWYRSQTRESLSKHIIEEAYEMRDSLLNNDKDALLSEMGDLLWQIMIHLHREYDDLTFVFEKMLDRLCTKLQRRNPHIFGDQKANTLEQARAFWIEVKKNENVSSSDKKQKKNHLPALIDAVKLYEKSTNRTSLALVSDIETLIDKYDIDYGKLLYTIVGCMYESGKDAETVLKNHLSQLSHY